MGGPPVAAGFAGAGGAGAGGAGGAGAGVGAGALAAPALGAFTTTGVSVAIGVPSPEEAEIVIVGTTGSGLGSYQTTGRPVVNSKLSSSKLKPPSRRPRIESRPSGISGSFAASSLRSFVAYSVCPMMAAIVLARAT